MKIKIAAAAAAFALSAGGIAQASTIIDFEELASGPTSSPISYPTATFSSSTGQFYINGAGVSQDLCPYTGNCVATLTVAFTNPVNNLSFTSVGDEIGRAHV